MKLTPLFTCYRFSPPPPGSSSRPTTPISKPPSSSKGLSSGILNDNKSQLTNGVSAPNDLSAHADADAEPEQRALAGVDKILDTCTELAAGCYETRALMSVQSSLDAGPASRGEKRGVRRFAGGE